MQTNHADFLDWLSQDIINAKKFLKSLDKVVKGRVVLVVDEKSGCLVTGFMPYKNNFRVRK